MELRAGGGMGGGEEESEKCNRAEVHRGDSIVPRRSRPFVGSPSLPGFGRGCYLRGGSERRRELAHTEVREREARFVR